MRRLALASGVSFDEQRPRPDSRVSRALRGDAGLYSHARTSPNATARSGPLTFTIQKHAARRLHYDLRLEIDGVLVSWPIPQGPSYDPNVRRLAIQTEDHPYAYGTFEGIIPAGEYGGGEVIVWGLRHLHGPSRKMGSLPDFRDRERAERELRRDLRKGHLRVFFNGRKLKGGWTLHRTRGEGIRSQWLFIKRRDGLEDPRRDVTLEDRSVLCGLRIEDLKAGLRDGQVHLRSRGGQAYEDRYPELVKAVRPAGRCCRHRRRSGGPWARASPSAPAGLARLLGAHTAATRWRGSSSHWRRAPDRRRLMAL